MPVTLELPGDAAPDGRTRNFSQRRKPPIVIGIVNNIGDAGMVATERQFTQLIAACSAGHDIRLRLYSLDGVPRAPETGRAMRGRYGSLRDLMAILPDALIVTGAEPSGPTLTDEPYWDELVALFDFARANTLSTIFSCLAAHAAALHFDGVPRVAVGRKISGVFASRLAAPHPLVDGLPQTFPMPHSRYNSLDEAALRAKRYIVLAASESGVDAFVKEEDSLLVFLQGHPEYGADSLLREFRRDLLRHQSGQMENCPEFPSNCLGRNLASLLPRLDAGGVRNRPSATNLLSEVTSRLLSERKVVPCWRNASQTLYRNWLAILSERRMGAAAHRANACLPSAARRAESGAPTCGTPS